MSEATPEMRDLAPAYALGALSPEEARAFEAALAKSPELQREVAEYRELNAVLAAGQPVHPPAALREPPPRWATGDRRQATGRDRAAR